MQLSSILPLYSELIPQTMVSEKTQRLCAVQSTSSRAHSRTRSGLDGRIIEYSGVVRFPEMTTYSNSRATTDFEGSITSNPLPVSLAPSNFAG
jgi:hypothetical protein